MADVKMNTFGNPKRDRPRPTDSAGHRHVSVRRRPFPRTVVLGVTNGYNGYLPTPEHHELSGYETWLGTSRVQKDASVIITDHLLEMLGELAKKE